MSKHFILLLALTLFVLPSLTLTQDDHDHEVSDETGEQHEQHALDRDHESAESPESGHDHHDHEAHDDELIVELTPAAMKLAGLELAEVVSGRIGRSIELPGEVGFDENNLVHVSPRFAGIALEARYRVGDYVSAGDTVAVVESNESMSPYAVKAATSGWIIKRHISPGEYLREDHSIFIIADLSYVWVNLAVYPKDAHWIKPGQKVQIRAIGANLQAEGTIDYITPVLDVDTRSITARVVLPNPDLSWRPGTFVQAGVMTESGDERLLVEKSALQVLDEKQVVFVADGPGRFRPVKVTCGDSDDHHVAITSGLAEGVRYVAAGAFELKAKIVTGNLGGHAGHGH
jgi:cobalt-zinc-cadmium efflux system membrane fusion protein